MISQVFLGAYWAKCILCIIRNQYISIKCVAERTEEYIRRSLGELDEMYVYM